MNEEICKNCKFWNAHNRKTTWDAECRRFPRHIATDCRCLGDFPATRDSDWCGEFKKILWENQV